MRPHMFHWRHLMLWGKGIRRPLFFSWYLLSKLFYPKGSKKLKQKKEKARLPHPSNLLLYRAVLSSNSVWTSWPQNVQYFHPRDLHQTNKEQCGYQWSLVYQCTSLLSPDTSRVISVTSCYKLQYLDTIFIQMPGSSDTNCGPNTVIRAFHKKIGF